MKAPLGPIKLELSQGCRDAAVIGGIGPLLNSWARAASASSRDGARRRRLDELASAVAGYRALDAAQRRALLEGALKLISTPVADGAGLAGLNWDAPVSALRGVGSRRAERLEQLGVNTIGDLLAHYPTRHEDRRTLSSLAELRHRQVACVAVRITGAGTVEGPPNHSRAEVPAGDENSHCLLVWFNQPYRAGQYPVGTELLVKGQPQVKRDRTELLVSEHEVIVGERGLHIGRLTPVYPLTSGVSQPFFRSLIAQALQRITELPTGAVPDDLVGRRGLVGFGEALRALHFPPGAEQLASARRRLVYEELYVLQASLARRRHEATRADEAHALPVEGVAEELSGALPFTLTDAQTRVVGEVLADLAASAPMQRLVHGEVGSGKTVIAAAAMLAACRAGRQAAMMAPTELLAEQHHATLNDLLAPLGLPVALLTAGIPLSGAKRLREGLADGTVKLVVGTHALFQQSVSFADLALAVVDEQHRFGVGQRAALTAKGGRPNLLAMSATPIPRTLALTAHGDFDLSVLDELPPGRATVTTELIRGRDRMRVYDLIIKLVARGQQAYIVCPVIERSENRYVVAAEEQFRRLQAYLMPTLRLGLVHSALPPDLLRDTMDAFRRGDLDVLVATTVVEVGVDVSNATVMMIENAERFGLSQLHQLRGRVARGSRPGLCLLVSGTTKPETVARLQVLVRTRDGFEVAREDLRRRGPGEMAGTRQHGLPDLRLADLLADTELLLEAREDAFATVEGDPNLLRPEHAALREALSRYGGQGWAL